jgi:hypothetical protein
MPEVGASLLIECQHKNCHLIAIPMANPDQEALMLRMEGWRIFDGISLTGQPIRVRLCPEHGGGVPQARKPQVLQGQYAFDLDG